MTLLKCWKHKDKMLLSSLEKSLQRLFLQEYSWFLVLTQRMCLLKTGGVLKLCFHGLGHSTENPCTWHVHINRYYFGVREMGDEINSKKSTQCCSNPIAEGHPLGSGWLGGRVCPTSPRPASGSGHFPDLRLLAVHSKGGFMGSAVSLVYSVALIGTGDVFVYHLLFSSL